LYRAPGGHLGPEVVAVARQRGLRVLRWSVDPSDYRRPEPRPLLDRIMADVRPGSIVVLHDGGGDRSSTVIMLKELIQRLKADGWGFATPTTPPTP
jgi:peptidoglycan/xylan/chitin deacetylase (PgdA/CDA1 family)